MDKEQQSLVCIHKQEVGTKTDEPSCGAAPDSQVCSMASHSIFFRSQILVNRKLIWLLLWYRLLSLRRNAIWRLFARKFPENELLRISKTRELWSSKTAFTITFFAAVNHHYDHKQRTLKHRNTQNGSKSTSHKPWPFEPVALNLFPKRSAKMIYGSEKRKRQNSCVYEKRSRRSFITENVARYEKLKPVPSAKNAICVTDAI